MAKKQEKQKKLNETPSPNRAAAEALAKKLDEEKKIYKDHKAATGDKVQVAFTGTFDDGKVFDTSLGREPLTFEIDAGQVIKGFNDAVKGMKLLEVKKIHLNASDAYGPRDESLIKKVPRDRLPKEQEPKPGMVLGIVLPNGMHIPAVITAVDPELITVDLNHPMAGKALNFEIKLLRIEPASEAKPEAADKKKNSKN